MAFPERADGKSHPQSMQQKVQLPRSCSRIAPPVRCRTGFFLDSRGNWKSEPCLRSKQTAAAEWRKRGSGSGGGRVCLGLDSAASTLSGISGRRGRRLFNGRLTRGAPLTLSRGTSTARPVLWVYCVGMLGSAIQFFLTI